MLTTRVIPCLDIRGGRTVKGVRFESLRDAGDPVELARRYEHEGADEIVMLDVSATREQRACALGVVRDLRRELGIPLTVGGGVAHVEAALDLLRAGADKVSVNSAGVARPGFLRDLSLRVGMQCVVLSIDALRDGNGWRVATHGGRRVTDLDAIEWASRARDLGVGEILLTSVDRDGTGLGYDLDLIARIREATDCPIIASGGASSPEHLVEAVRSGGDALLVASMLHDGHATIGQLKRTLQRHGIEVRT